MEEAEIIGALKKTAEWGAALLAKAEACMDGEMRKTYLRLAYRQLENTMKYLTPDGKIRKP